MAGEFMVTKTKTPTAVGDKEDTSFDIDSHAFETLTEMGRRDVLAPCQQLPDQLEAESARGPGDEPRPCRFHDRCSR